MNLIKCNKVYDGDLCYDLGLIGYKVYQTTFKDPSMKCLIVDNRIHYNKDLDEKDIYKYIAIGIIRGLK